MQTTDPEQNNALEDETGALEAQSPSSMSRHTVIGIGASAGGLTALEHFFQALPADTGMTFVVVLHLSPEHESMLAEVLQPYTQMPVTQVNERVAMQPNHVYVIPPGKRLVVKGGILDLAELDMQWGRRLQIDAFFRSLAEDQGDGAAIILSGAGSDGSVGIRGIKEGGGLILVQDPAEAEYDSMPLSAIATGLADIVAPAAELAVQLVKAKRSGAALDLPSDPVDLSESDERTLAQILAYLRLRMGHDFSGYKPASLLRRIGRRMGLAQSQTLPAYLNRLRQDHDESDALCGDLLIHVTEFFRDPEAWQVLAETVIPQLFAKKGRNDIVRAWTVGCATGEEAYGLAILLLEHAATLQDPPQIQLFASDLGENALDYARNGVYPAAIADNVSEARLTRFFVQENNHFRVRDDLRERVLFTPHNLLQAPPFSRLDLILCRNLLIYLQTPVQEQVFQIFHYALLPNGYLFLGSAETTGSADGLFDPLDSKHRIYQRRAQEGGQRILPALSLLTRPGQRSELPETPEHKNTLSTTASHYLMLEELAPPSMLVDEHYNLLHLSETAGRYLQPVGGPFSRDLIQLVRPELQTELRMALHAAFEQEGPATSQPVPVQFNGAPHPVSLLVRANAVRRQALVIFLEEEVTMAVAAGPTTPGQDGDNAGLRARIEQLEAAQRHVQQRRQAMREAHEATVEELHAATEELQSTNEEYRATLEELETSKEELQSINEELQTLNMELKDKALEAGKSRDDLQNLLAATEIAALFLDRDLHVVRYTTPAVGLFNFMPADRGRPIAHLRTNLIYNELEVDARRVLETLMPVAREIESADGRWFQVNVRPYRTQEDKIDGVVIIFFDITAIKAGEEALRQTKVYAESIVDTFPDALIVLEPDLRVRTANDSFYQMFDVDPQKTEGELIYSLGNGQWDIPELRTLLEEILPANNVFTGYQVEHEFETIGRRTMLLNGRRLDHVQRILLVITDITEHARTEAALRASEERRLLAVEAAAMGDWMLDVARGIVECSPRMREMHRLETEGEKPLTIDEHDQYLHPDDRAAVHAARAAALDPEGDGHYHIEFRFLFDDGEICWFDSSGQAIFEEREGRRQATHLLGVMIDITGRKQAQFAEMRQRILQGQELERTQLAHEIHDGPMQELTAITFELALLSGSLEDESLQTRLSVVNAKLERNIRLLRHVMTTLRPPAVVSFGLAAAIERHVEELRLQQPDLAVEVAVDAEIPKLPEEVILGLYRICQQALYNIVQHANADQVWVRLHCQDDLLTLEVEDNGVGFTMPEELVELPRRKHLGIVGMMERARAIGGELTVDSTPGQGTRVRMTLPLSQA